jgi:Ni/Co efflux regulator RcnB
MRTFWLAATATFAMTTVGANAQRVVAHGPAMRTGSMPRPMQHPAPMRPQAHAGWQGGHQVQKGGQWQGQGQVQHAGQWQHSSSSASSHSNSHSSVHVNVRPRWGARIGNRWWGGVRAPGGWGAYRRPVRGYALPSYWVSPNWLISDWGAYGLSQPPYGYNWSRYYDDAVLVDGRGSVYDTVGGIDWDGGDAAGGGYAEDQGDYADDGGYAEGGYQGGGYEQPGAPYPYPDHRDSGIGGAAIGAVVGGVAGNRIAGRGNRVAGTVIGAGVGAAAGYAIDRAEDRGPPPPPQYHQGAGYAPPPPMAVASGRPVVVQSGGYYSNGYYYPAPTVTTVTVTTTPVVTTTTEVFEDTVTYTRPARKVWRKRVVRARPRCTCS